MCEQPGSFPDSMEIFVPSETINLWPIVSIVYQEIHVVILKKISKFENANRIF